MQATGGNPGLAASSTSSLTFSSGNSALAVVTNAGADNYADFGTGGSQISSNASLVAGTGAAGTAYSNATNTNATTGAATVNSKAYSVGGTGGPGNNNAQGGVGGNAFSTAIGQSSGNGNTVSVTCNANGGLGGYINSNSLVTSAGSGGNAMVISASGIALGNSTVNVKRHCYRRQRWRLLQYQLQRQRR